MSARKCHATSKGSGKRCQQPAIPGGSVCRYHGGAAPQVKQKATERLAALVDPAITSLSRLLRSKAEHVRLAAVRDVLDRNGHKPPERHQLGGIPDAPPIAFDVSRLTDEQLTTLEAIFAAVSVPESDRLENEAAKEGSRHA